MSSVNECEYHKCWSDEVPESIWSQKQVGQGQCPGGGCCKKQNCGLEGEDLSAGMVRWCSDGVKVGNSMLNVNGLGLERGYLILSLDNYGAAYNDL